MLLRITMFTNNAPKVNKISIHCSTIHTVLLLKSFLYERLLRIVHTHISVHASVLKTLEN
jgi:hypothetical protein